MSLEHRRRASLRLPCLLALAAACAAPGRGPDVAFRADFDTPDGRLAAVHHEPTATSFRFAEAGLRVETTAGAIDTATDRPVRSATRGGGLAAEYASGDLELDVDWTVADGRAERRWTIRGRGGRAFRVLRSTETFRAASPFRQVALHTDGAVYRVPINLFLRGDRLSLALGLTYPWVAPEILPGNAGARLACEIEVEVPAGGTFASETTFLVACPYAGLLCDKAGGSARILRLDEPEPMDWGEVWAMQDYVAARLPEPPLPEDGFFAWMDGWWARLKGEVPPREAVDRAAALGVSMFCLPQVWFGHGEHPHAARALLELQPGQRLAFPPEVRDLLAHARAKGVRIGGYCQPAFPQFGMGDWFSRKADGAPNLYIGNRYNCLANPEYAQAFLELQSQVIADAGTTYWAWDGRLISYAEADNDPPEERYRPAPCFAAGHGHPPGRQFFQEYRAVRGLIAELRRRHPRVCLETYWGLKRGIPWVMDGLNAVENYYEAGPPLDQRLQCWYNQQYRFLPPHLNWVHVDATEPDAFETSLISAISASTHALLGTCYRGLDRPENVRTLKRWREFADRVRPYLARKRDLFGQPGAAWADGSAHCLGDRGLLFLFRSRYAADPGEGMYRPPPGGGDRPAAAAVAVPLDRRIGLTAGDRFRVVRLHPGPRRAVGGYAYGEEACLPAVADAEVYAIVPAAEGAFDLRRLAPDSRERTGVDPERPDGWGEEAAPETGPPTDRAARLPAFRAGSILRVAEERADGRPQGGNR